MEVIQQMNYSAVIPEVQVSIAASSQTSACFTAHSWSGMCAMWFVHNMYESAAGNIAAFKMNCNVSNVDFEFSFRCASAAGTQLLSKVKQEQQRHLQQQASTLYDRQDSHLRDKLVELLRLQLV